jgi:tetratricopeptide (TPR) repeat protein
MKNKLTLLIALCIISTVITSCSSSIEKSPENVLNNYYGNIASGKYEDAYLLLSGGSRYSISKIDFIALQKLRKEAYDFIDYKLVKGNVIDNYISTENVYRDAIEYTVIVNETNLIDDKVVARQNKLYLVNDDGIKIDLGKINVKTVLAISYSDVGDFYSFSKSRDYDKALKNYKMSIEASQNSVTAYYGLSNVYINKDMFAEAVSNMKTGIQIDPDNVSKSNAYFKFGLIYMDKYKKEKEFNRKDSRSKDKKNEFIFNVKSALVNVIELTPGTENALTAQKMIASLEDEIYTEIRTQTQNYENDLISSHFNQYLSILNTSKKISENKMLIEFCFKPPEKLAPQYRVMVKLFDKDGGYLSYFYSDQLDKYLKYDEKLNLFIDDNTVTLSQELNNTLLKSTASVTVGIVPVDINFMDPYVDRKFLENK